MKKLFIYYSLTGNGDVVADYLKKEKCDIRKIITKEKLPNNTLLRLLTGGFKSIINYKDKLDNFDNNIKKYDNIIIGTPIWNNRISAPINTVLNNLDLKNKHINFILYSKSGNINKIKKYINKKYPNSIIINLKEPKENINELYKINV